MSASFFRRKFFWCCLFLALVGLAAWGWWERQPLLAWYYTKGLAAASDDERPAFVERLEPLGADALDPLVGKLHSGDEQAQVNCGWALVELARRWGLDTPDSRQLSGALADHFATSNAVGQREALLVWRALVSKQTGEAAPDWLTDQVTRALSLSAQNDSEETRPAALALAALLLQRDEPAQGLLVDACRQLVAAGLKDHRAECRLDAVRLAAAPGVAQLELVRALLANPYAEPAAEVRATALLALNRQEELFSTDEVLPYLHDVDPEVRGVAEQTLKARGLSPAHLDLARQMTDPQPHVRARVPGLVHDFPDLDTKLWLERLSRDGSPAVRAAVVRAAGEARDWQLTDRLGEMARRDPSPTVRQIARFYLQQHLAEPLPGRGP
jgi:hypothetical protein